MEKKMDLESYSFNHLDHDYVADEHEPKDFVGRKTRSHKDLWRKFYTPNFKTIVWQYNPLEVEESYNFFAPSPLTPNAKSLPVYLRIESENEDHRSLFKDSIPNSLYVPLFALIAMGCKEGLDFTQPPMKVPKEAPWQTLEPEFLNCTNDWKPKFSREPPKILARKEDGSLVNVQLSNEWEGWQDILPQMGILDTAAKHGGTDKIQRAAGKRPDEAGQKEIMGGVSATEIGNAMGWGSKRLRSGVFPAEWLHLSAFSWGGIAGDEDPEGFTTSQNFENLVFGTSETNSLMTRYETAWERFFLAEKELAGTEEGIIGSLNIYCNDFSRPILWDMVISRNKSKNFSTADFTFTKQELELVRENLFGTKRYLDSKPKT
ncbi:hypothetical protein FOVSG1_012203 [Fusarium oxysporum f. sp. vasinfectum]